MPIWPQIDHPARSRHFDADGPALRNGDGRRRQLGGFTKPSKANKAAFAAAVESVTAASSELLGPAAQVPGRAGTDR